ncbi:succinate dehydrogenase subunit 7A, mitochondrial [Apium graveolens]|uniref:succinate dehydrogenase subunit 7A, mitochondrial n=1 Tax=Apium graveolens TaxID=4045 RepID=UPI003D7A4FA1
MAFVNNTTIFSQLRSHSQKTGDLLRQSRRGIHTVELGAREKALLAPDPALDRFKSYKKDVKRVKRIGDVLTVVVVAGCCYELYVRATTREEARRQAS